MKKAIFLLSMILVGILVITYYSCETDPKETCEQDEYCDAQLVTICCTDNECIYKYNGKEYAEDQEDQLAIDMGCSTAVVLKDSESQDNYLSNVIARLKAQMDRVRQRVSSRR